MPTVLVLIVDDEPMIRWAMEQTLREAGYEVAVAATAAEGMALFHTRRPRVVFLDLRLPDEGGFTVLKRMKEETGDGSAVIMMTAFSELCTAAEARRLGAYDYLEKPFAFESLAALVAEAVADTLRRTA
jgi:DNA-binding NtrC family response regulator